MNPFTEALNIDTNVIAPSQRVAFTVPGVPIAQPRPRATLAHGGKGARIHEVTHIKNAATGERRPHPIAAFKATVRLAVEQVYRDAPLTGPLAARCVFIFPRTRSLMWKSKPMPRIPRQGKPDADNLLKSLADALNGLLWIDDSQLVHVVIEKWIAAGDEQPRCEIVVEAL